MQYTAQNHLVHAAQQGEAVAWNALYELHYPWLYATALRICGNTPAAKDAVQDTLLTGYLKLSQLKDLNAFAGWLKTILLNICYRNRNKADNHINTFTAKNNFSWQNEFERKQDILFTQNRLFETVYKLPEVLRSVVLLRYYSKYQSYQEMATLLGIPVGTVRSRLNQARQKINEHWTKCEDPSDKSWKHACEWNHFYEHIFCRSLREVRNEFIGHLQTDVSITFTSGKRGIGSTLIEKGINEDIEYGTNYLIQKIATCGSISIIEGLNDNPPEYPNRCPVSTIFVLYRNNDKVQKFVLHNSAK